MMRNSICCFNSAERTVPLPLIGFLVLFLVFLGVLVQTQSSRLAAAGRRHSMDRDDALPVAQEAEASEARQGV